VKRKKKAKREAEAKKDEAAVDAGSSSTVGPQQTDPKSSKEAVGNPTSPQGSHPPATDPSASVPPLVGSQGTPSSIQGPSIPSTVAPDEPSSGDGSMRDASRNDSSEAGANSPAYSSNRVPAIPGSIAGKSATEPNASNGRIQVVNA